MNLQGRALYLISGGAGLVVAGMIILLVPFLSVGGGKYAIDFSIAGSGNYCAPSAYISYPACSTAAILGPLTIVAIVLGIGLAVGGYFFMSHRESHAGPTRS